MKHTIKIRSRCLAIIAILALSAASNGAEFGGYFSVTRWGPATLMAGMELGLLGFNSDVILENTGSVSAESGFEVYNWTVSLALRFGESGKRYIDLDAGLGKYWGTRCTLIAWRFHRVSTRTRDPSPRADTWA